MPKGDLHFPSCGEEVTNGNTLIPPLVGGAERLKGVRRRE